MRALVLAYLCDVCVSWVEGEGLQSSPCRAKLFLKVLKESLVLTTQCWKIMVMNMRKSNSMFYMLVFYEYQKTE